MSRNLKVNSLVPATGTEIGIGTTGGTIDFRCAATFGGNVTIGGTLTYDEVINIDSIGIITARTGIDVVAGDLVIPDSVVHRGDTNTKIRFPSADTFSVELGGDERLRITTTGTAQIKGASGEAISTTSLLTIPFDLYSGTSFKSEAKSG